MSKGAHWTSAEIASLAKLARSHTVLEMTHLLNRSNGSIRRRLEEMGMSAMPAPRSRKDADGLDLKARVQRLTDDGYRPAEIARITGGSIDYVRFVANIYCGGMSKGNQQPGADHEKHLRSIDKASAGKGFPYCLARLPLSTSKSNTVDRPPFAEVSRFKTPREAADI